MRLLIFPFLLLSSQILLAQTSVLTELCDLPSVVSETSGIVNGPNGWFWTHNDSGNPAELYCVDTNGVLQRTVSVIGDVNTDWEEVAKDDEGNLYVGNFGNNSLDRTDLHIVKIPRIDTCTVNAVVTDTIRFSYPDQTAFPPSGSYGNFDMEAMFWFNDSLHLFSKDRSNPSTGYTKHYRLPTQNGTYVAELLDSFYVGHTSFVFAVTAADISENADSVVLLTSDKVLLFTNFTGSDFFSGDVLTLGFSFISQKEGICFRNGSLYITDEQSFGMGGKMYRLHPSVFIGVNETYRELSVRTIYRQDLSLQSIEFEGEEVEWKLLSTDGKLVRSGNSRGRILASEFNGKQGMFVIQLSTDSGAKAMLIQL
ncbi:MAG: hypothetical protein GC178_02650 [Flavobacteriales bacterium]|nr:hypothetical protein [Flavobacteriales bacterium]